MGINDSYLNIWPIFYNVATITLKIFDEQKRKQK